MKRSAMATGVIGLVLGIGIGAWFGAAQECVAQSQENHGPYARWMLHTNGTHTFKIDRLHGTVYVLALPGQQASSYGAWERLEEGRSSHRSSER